MKKVLFISSTGGHLTELMQLEALFKQFDSYIVTEKQKNNLFLREKYGKHTCFLLSGTYTGLKNKVRYPFVFILNTLISLYIFVKINPDCIVTTGAHNTLPMICIAHLFRRKIIFIETFAALEHPTKAGFIAYKIADHFIVQWANMKRVYPKADYLGWIF